MKPLKLFTLAAISVAIAACSKSHTSDSIDHSSINSDYRGIWVSEDKGKVLLINHSSMNIYQFTSDYCLIEDSYENATTEDLKQTVTLANDKNSAYWFAGYGPKDIQAPGFTLTKQNQLPQACADGIIKSKGEQGYERNPELTFNIFRQIFEEYYIGFELKGVDWTALGEQNAVSINANSSDLDLLVAMDRMIEPLADPHNSINAPDVNELSYTNKLSITEKLIQEYAEANNLTFPILYDAVTEQQLAEIQAYLTYNVTLQKELVKNYAESDEDITTAANEVFWFKNQGIGYIHIGRMYNYYPEQEDKSDLEYDTQEIAVLDSILDRALSDLANVDGLIIDVRTNPGGKDFVSLAIASRFTSEKILAYKKRQGRSASAESNDVYIEPRGEMRYTGPIALLVSASTNSGAEVFTLAMSQLPNVTVIGEATQGAFSDIEFWHLPNGFEIGLSSEMYFTPQGDWLEGRGVPVDIEVPFFTPAQREAEIDLGIETAVTILAN